MSESSPPESKGFKVVDRRGHGEPEASPTEVPPAAAPDPGAAAGAAVATEPPAAPSTADEVLGPIDFQTFLVSLASSALIHLGVAPHPESGQIEASLPHAQQTIDLLALLQEKTKGNLSDDEGKLLQALLRDLRLRFVEATSLPGRR